MDPSHRLLLNAHRVQLLKDLDADEVLQILVSKQILNDRLVDRIQSKPTQFDKNVEFLTLLAKRGPAAFSLFVAALNETGQVHLAQLFESEGSSLNDSISARVEATADWTRKDVSAFSFTSPQSCKKQPSNLTPVKTNGLKLRRPIENDSGSLDEKPCCSLSKYQKHDIQQKNCEESMDVVPSPCDALSDLMSTTSFDILHCEAELSQPRSKKSSHITANQSFSTNNTVNPCQSIASHSKTRAKDFLRSCDLADGPTINDMEVQLSSHQFRSIHEIDSYNISQGLKGLALIISIDNFEESACLDNRLGSNIDRCRLELVLRQLGFRVYILLDGTAKEIWGTLMEFATLEDHERLDCMITVVMSHGNNGVFYGRDGKPVFIDPMLELFSNERCKGLQNKPKIFLFQSCRGDKPDKGVDEVDSPAKNSNSTLQAPQSDVYTNPRIGPKPNLAPPIRQNKLPTFSDMLVGYATVQGYTAMRNTKHGSWFIQALVRVLAFHACDKHLLEIMTIVNNMIKSREGYSPSSEFHRCKEMSEFKSSLCKKLYFFPGV
uniref:Caspase-2 n=1 Tax=Phallusia mammillata TaxID=59560 RepID=A0A6F9D949_9ASCI|nr:caspase-2 [Phallusia mammillata]